MVKHQNGAVTIVARCYVKCMPVMCACLRDKGLSLSVWANVMPEHFSAQDDLLKTARLLTNAIECVSPRNFAMYFN